METGSPNTTHAYDVAIIGGGLAGLSLSIQLAKAGKKVILFEKEKYPFNRVCGEYISMESWDFIRGLGLPLQDMHLPLIKELVVSSPSGKIVKHPLPLGGFGISRYLLDDKLENIAKETGVTVMEQTKVTDVQFENDQFLVSAKGISHVAAVVTGCFGKRSNLDVKWERPFTRNKPNKLNNYIGIKYHIRTDAPPDTIALHNFENGYCGISKVEADRYCLCYLTTAINLHDNNNSVETMEKNVLQQNPFLKKIFSEAEFVWDAPEIISQISFEKKGLVEDHMLMTGDAAGMITPLCGNGMSMALHGSKIAFGCIINYLDQRTTREKMEKEYTKRWNKQFASRLKAGRLIQSMFGKPWLTNAFIRFVKPFPFLVKLLIRSTHGKPF